MDQFDRQLEELLTNAPGDPWDELVLAFTYGLPIFPSEEKDIEGCERKWSNTPHNFAPKMMDIIEQRYPFHEWETDTDGARKRVRQALRDIQARILALGFVNEAMKMTKWVDYYARQPEE